MKQPSDSASDGKTAIGPTLAETSAPICPPLIGVSDAEYARRAAQLRARNRGTRFYDGFRP